MLDAANAARSPRRLPLSWVGHGPRRRVSQARKNAVKGPRQLLRRRKGSVLSVGPVGSDEVRGGPRQPDRVGESLWEYARQVAMRWPWLLAGWVAVLLGVYGVVHGRLLGVPTWMWFVVGFAAWSVAQFLAFHEIRHQRNEVLTVPTSDKVSMYAVAASLGSVPAPIVAPVDYQVHALRQAVAFLRAQGRTEIDVRVLDSVLKRLERDGVQLTYEPLDARDCQDGLDRLVETGDLIDMPGLGGFSFRLSPVAQPDDRRPLRRDGS